MKEVVPLIAIAIPAAGWFVTSGLQSVREARNSRVTSVISYTERQLEQLYGPLMALLVEGEQAWKECLRALGRDPDDLKNAEREFSDALSGKHDQPPLTEEQLKTWIFWIENAFFPRNDRIATLISDNAHLVEGVTGEPGLPASYRQFLAHHNTWRLRHKQWRKQKTPYSWCWTVPWPEPFNVEVVETFGALKERHNEYLRVQRTQGLRSVFFPLPDEPIREEEEEPAAT
jgi:hypothetical protein